MSGGARPKIIWLGRSFLAPFFASAAEIVHIGSPLDAHLLDEHRDAAFVLCMNDTVENHLWRRPILIHAKQLGLPRCWWTIEDPNAWGYFIQNVTRVDFDFIFTSDRHCLQLYRGRVSRYYRGPGFRAYWLPLAASPEWHVPAPAAENAADFVLVAQSYLYWPARRAAVENLIKPLLAHGYTLNLFCPEDGWREEPEIQQHRVGGETYSERCGNYYVYGKVALGVNCQCGNGEDTYYHTAMTSMRTFEALACGKALLAYESSAYEQLGFRWGEHFVWSRTPEQALDLARRLLENPQGQQAYASQGREFVLANHTYAHRLDRIMRAVYSQANPEDWR